MRFESEGNDINIKWYISRYLHKCLKKIVQQYQLSFLKMVDNVEIGISS